ncbi:MAG: hypothetical protein M3R39_07815, partial [Actinomycetota bacterium]|nr:hypothetical protein [Actinomycetota bacterium]
MRPAGEVLEQVEQRRGGPVDVFDHHDEWLLARSLFEQAAHGPEQLAARSGGVCRPDCAQHALSDELSIFGVGEQLSNAVVAAKCADDLHQRPERDPVAVGKAAPADRARLLAHAATELGGESR